MIDTSRRSLLAFKAIAIALFLSLGMTACGKQEESGKKEEKRASAPVAGKPAAEGQKATGAPTAQPAASGIGKLEAFDGDVRVVDSRGERRVQVGMILQEGDSVRSGPNGWALLAMADGASITMRSDSELRFDNYRYVADGEASQNSAGMSLVKGAMRSITGLIGQTNRSAYHIKTQTATIGIRGTDHEPAYYPPAPPGQKAAHAPGTYDKVNEGESVIRRPSGEVPVRRGQTAFAHEDVKVRPQILSRPPAFYQQYAQLDQKVVDRRAEFHRQFAQQEERRQQERRQQQDAQKKGQDELKAKQEKEKQQQQKGKDDKKGKNDKKGKDDKKQAAATQKGGKAQDQKADKTQDKSRVDDQKKAKQAQAAKGEQKAALPPSVQERIKQMQRGDKGASPSPQQQQQQTQEQPQRQQRAQEQPQRQPQPQQSIQQRLQQQQQQQTRQQQQRQGQQQPQQQDEKKKRQRPEREER